MSIWSKKFWRATAERSVSTFGESFAGYMLASGATDVVHLNWGGAGATAAFATVLAVAKALAASQVGSSGPSLTDAEVLDKSKPFPGWGQGI